MPYDALVFDLGGVIVAHDNPLLYRRIASRCAAGWSADRVRAVATLDEWGTGTPVAVLHGRLRREAGYGAGWDVFVGDWCCHFALDTAMLALLRDLRERERVIIFSNTNKEHWEFLVEASGGLLRTLEHFLSFEMGLIKPDTAAFAHVAEAAGVSPPRCIFFDDLEENVAGARRAGFQAEVFRDRAGLERLLAENGVRVS